MEGGIINLNGVEFVACCLFLKAMAATRVRIWKWSRMGHEQKDFVVILCLELDCILCPLAPLCVVDTRLELYLNNKCR